MTGVLPPLAGFLLFAAAMVLGSILTSDRRRGRAHRHAGARRPAAPRPAAPRRGGQSPSASCCSSSLAVLASRSGGVPPIHDITTDPGDPPQFVAAARASPADRAAISTTRTAGPIRSRCRRRHIPISSRSGSMCRPTRRWIARGKAAEDLGWQIVGSTKPTGASKPPTPRASSASSTTSWCASDRHRRLDRRRAFHVARRRERSRRQRGADPRLPRAPDEEWVTWGMSPKRPAKKTPPKPAGKDRVSDPPAPAIATRSRSSPRTAPG